MSTKHMIDDAENENPKIEIREAIWVAVMSTIGILFLLLLNRSGKIMADFSQTGTSNIPVSFWVLVTLILGLCISVFYLLKDSRSKELKVIGIALTGIVPAIATVVITANLVLL